MVSIPYWERVSAFSDFKVGNTNKCIAPELAALEEQLLNCGSGMRVLDPYAGYGFNILAMSRENHPTFYLQERDPRIAGILAAFCLIDGVEIGALRCRDSSTGLFPETSEFDRILTEPSFSYERTDTRTDLSEKDLIPEIATTMEMFPFSLAASRLSKRGMAVIKCNLSLLYSSSSNKQKGRTELVNRNLIDAVIELPPELLSEPGETAALVIIRKGRKEDTIHMINARRAGDVSPVSIYRSPDSYYDPDREVHALVPRQEILANGANLCAGPYLKKELRYHTGDEELSALLARRDARAQDIQESDRKIRQLIKNLL